MSGLWRENRGERNREHGPGLECKLLLDNVDKPSANLMEKKTHKTNNCWFATWLPYTKGKERPRKEADHFRFVGGKFKQRNLHARFVLDGCKMRRSPYPPARIVKVYREALTGFCHIYCLDGLKNTLLSQGWDLDNGSHCRNCEQNVHSKHRGGDEDSSIAWV